MAELTPPQCELASQLQVDQDCRAAAATFSPDMQTVTVCPDRLIDDLSPEEIKGYLKRVACGEGTQVMNELNRRASVGCESTVAQCTPGAFFSKMSKLREARLSRESEERADRHRAEETARKRHLSSVFNCADQTWNELDSLMKTKKNAAYDDIASTLKELAEACEHKEKGTEFQARLSMFRSKWSNRPAMMRRIGDL